MCIHATDGSWLILNAGRPITHFKEDACVVHLQANPAQDHGDVHSNEGYRGSTTLQAASAACCMQHGITCTKMRAHVEDQDVDPAAPNKTLVRGEQSGCSLGEQLISSISAGLHSNQ